MTWHARNGWPRSAGWWPASPTRCGTHSPPSSCGSIWRPGASRCRPRRGRPSTTPGGRSPGWNRLVADLLIVAGRALGPRAPLDVGRLLRARAEALAPWAALRRVTITGAPEPARRSAMATRWRARSTTFCATRSRPPRMARRSRPPSKRTMTGQGCGTPIAATVFPPAAPERDIFEPFFTTNPDGTGLGLAISRAIARAHGGDLTYGRGGEITRLELTLPGTKGGAPRRRRSRTRAHERGGADRRG